MPIFIIVNTTVTLIEYNNNIVFNSINSMILQEVLI